MRNVNDELREYNCSDNYYKYGFGMVITDGVKELCDRFQCFWFVDVVCSYQSSLGAEEFQSWKLLKNPDSSALVTCDNGNGKILKSQRIPWTDFDADVANVWCEGNVVLLPSEH